MRYLIYFHPNKNWKHFNYRTGELDDEYINPTWKNQKVWREKYGQKFRDKEKQFLETEKALKERVQKKSERISEFTWSPSELLYLTKGKMTGTFPINGRLPDKKSMKN